MAAPKMAISCRGKHSASTKPTAPTAASAMRSFVNSSLTRDFFPAPMLNPTTGMQPAAMPTTTEMMIWKNFMTIPTTAMGIWAYCACPKMGSRAPYLRSMLLMAAMEATREIWERKLVMPSSRVFAQILPLSRKSCRLGFIIFMCRRYHTARTAVMIWPITVARRLYSGEAWAGR